MQQVFQATVPSGPCGNSGTQPTLRLSTGCLRAERRVARQATCHQGSRDLSQLQPEKVEASPGSSVGGNPNQPSEFFDTRQVRMVYCKLTGPAKARLSNLRAQHPRVPKKHWFNAALEVLWPIMQQNQVPMLFL